MANLDEMLALLRSHNDGRAAIVAESVVRILKAAYPKERIDPLSIDDILSHVSFDRAAERRRLTGLYAVAIDGFRAK